MRYVVLLLLCNVANAEDNAAPTVHPITDAEREDAVNRCSGYRANYDRVLKNVAGKPQTQRITDALAQYKGKLDECTTREDARLDGIRVNGTASERYQLQQAAERAAQEKAEAEQQAAIERDSNDPKLAPLAWSALYCGWQADRTEALEAIKGYRKAARLGGVLNLSEVNNWQEEVMRADRHIGAAQAALKHWKVKPSCKDPVVAKIAYCMTDDVHGQGECDTAQAYVQIARSSE